MEGRTPVALFATDGGRVATVDISGAMRRFRLLRHRLEQFPDTHLRLTVLPLPGDDPPVEADLAAVLRELFGMLPMTIDIATCDWAIDGKATPYVGALLTRS